MKKIFHNVLDRLNNIIIEEKNIFKDNILNLVEKYNITDVSEYYIDNDIFYSNGFTIYKNISNTIKPIGFERNNILYIFKESD